MKKLTYYGFAVIWLLISISLSIAQNNSITYGDTLDSDLIAETQSWQFTGGEGHTVSIGVNSTEIDALVQLQSADGTVLIEDDNSGKGTNALIRDFVLPAQATYTIVVSSADGTTGSYTLSLNSPDRSLSPELETYQFEFLNFIENDTLSIDTIAEVYVEDDGLSMRSDPSIGENLLEKIPTHTEVRIIDGPVESSGYKWWKVQLPHPVSAESNMIGWSVEGADGLETLIPLQQIVTSDKPDCRHVEITTDLSIDLFPTVYREDALLVFADDTQQNEYRLQLPISPDEGKPIDFIWSPNGMLAISRVAPDLEGLTAFVTLNLEAGTYCKFQFESAWLDGIFSWSPDSYEVVFSLQDALYILNADTNTFRRLEVGDNVRTPAWSSDGERIAFGLFETEYMMVGFSSFGIYTVRPDGTDLQSYATDVEVMSFGMAWLPNSSNLLAHTLLDTDTPIRATTTLFDMSTGVYKTLYTHNPPKNESSKSDIVRGWVWTDDGTSVYLSSPNGLILRDLSADKNELLIESTTGSIFSCLSKNETTVFYSTRTSFKQSERKVYSIEIATNIIQQTAIDPCWDWRGKR